MGLGDGDDPPVYRCHRCPATFNDPDMRRQHVHSEDRQDAFESLARAVEIWWSKKNHLDCGKNTCLTCDLGRALRKLREAGR